MASAMRTEVPTTRLLATALTLTSLFSCTPAPPAPDCAPPDVCPIATTCPDGFAPDGSDAGCVGILPAGDCPPGTTPKLGKATCEPVGWTTCPEGFTEDGSGWGCAPLVADTCAPGERPAIGSQTCAPVGSCSALFPPAEATHFVDPAGPTDATHFQTLTAAITAAPAGAVIAVAAGTYRESLTLRRPVSLVGKCAPQVRIEGPFSQMAGILVSGAQGVTLRGLTLANHALSGVYVYKGGSAELFDVIADGNVGNGLFVTGAGSVLRASHTLVHSSKPDGAGKFGWGAGAQSQGSLELSDSALLANTGYGVALTSGATTSLLRVVVRDTVPGPTGELGYGVVVQGASTATISRSLIERSTGVGVKVSEAQSTATLTESVIRLTVPDSVPLSGHGAVATTGGAITLRASVVAENARSGVMVKGATSSARVEGSVVRGPLPFRPGRFAYGIVADETSSLEVVDSAVVGTVSNALMTQRGATAHLTGVLVRDTVTHPSDLDAKLSGTGVGLTVGQGSTVVVEGSAFVGNHSSGVVANVLAEPGQTPDPSAIPPTVTLASSVILGTLPGANGLAGHGVDVAGGSQVRVDRSVLSGNREAGVLVVQPGSAVELGSTLVSGTLARVDGSMGHGVVANLGSSATLRSSWVQKSAGVGAAFSASAGRLLATAFLDNLIGLHVQSGSVLVTTSDAQTPPGPLEVRVSADCVFAGNAARLGTELVPLPEPVTH